MHAAETPIPASAIDDVLALAADDMNRVDELIRESLASDVDLVSNVARYIVMSGGKRLRPMLVLLAARALGYDGDAHYRAAAIIEFIHTATLLHDDVVDSSDRRRGQASANAVFGNQASVLVGDFLYSRAFQMMVDLDSMHIMQILADATNTIAAGEVLQLMNVHDPDTTEAAYDDVIYRKTAKLFEAGTRIAGVLAGASTGVEASLAAYGRELGTAFQLVDDALDYDASAEELGKNLGDDLTEGKPTLPLIVALRDTNGPDHDFLRQAIIDGGADRLDRVRAVIESTGALQYTLARAQEAADKAIDALVEIPDSDHKQALIALADFSVKRRS
jgi:octaprenyl-diphosphate synthase